MRTAASNGLPSPTQQSGTIAKAGKCSRSKGKAGYDLLCTKGGQQEHVEVKGIRGTRPTFIITASELAQATSDKAFRLCVVTDALGDPHLLYLEGGQFKEQAVLTPLAYRAEVHFP